MTLGSVAFGRWMRGPWVAWSLLAGTAVVTGVLVGERDLRSPATVVAAVLSVGSVLLGLWLHRPRSPHWPLLALMLGFWAISVVLVHVQGGISAAAVVCVWAGQAVAFGITMHVLRGGSRSSLRSFTAGLDVAVMAVVLVVVGAQVVRAGTAGASNSTTVVVSGVDVVLLGMLVRFSVSRSGLVVSNALVLVASFLAIVYDLVAAVQGRRIALPGEPDQVVGVAFLLIFAAAALHPSMTSAFDPRTFAPRRRPSTSLIGLLPLIMVPYGVWWVAHVAGARSLPPWAVPAAGAVIAGICLLRAGAALRSSEYLADHDPLTELANRRGLGRAFEQLEPADGWSLLLIDLDDFKQVNDTHGHDIGDELLLELRNRLLIAAGSGSVAARLGGDEFVVLVATVQASAVANRFLGSLLEPVVVGDLALRAGASIGIADARKDTPLTELLTEADVAMYAAKAAGGGQVLRFHAQMRIEVTQRFNLSSQVRQLLRHENPDVGGLEIHYQPLVELSSGRVIGAEALVRWRHPDLGLLAPGDWLGLVTSNNLDAQLDFAVLHEVVCDLAHWRELGLRALTVSLNLTRDSLEDPRLADNVLAALAAAGVPPSQLHVEITEHHELSPDSPAEHTLRELRAAGVGVYLDDYGTGYTSLEYLRRFPIQVLKLDRSVTMSLDSVEVPLVAAVNAMATELQLEVLAEGVETNEQRDHLLELGIRYGQGYLFSRPLPAIQYAATMLSPDGPPTLPAQSLPHDRVSQNQAPVIGQLSD